MVIDVFCCIINSNGNNHYHSNSFYYYYCIFVEELPFQMDEKTLIGNSYNKKTAAISGAFLYCAHVGAIFESGGKGIKTGQKCALDRRVKYAEAILAKAKTKADVMKKTVVVFSILLPSKNE